MMEWPATTIALVLAAVGVATAEALWGWVL